MAVLVLRRLVWGALVLWAVVTLTFVASLLSPVDPVEVYAGRFATEDVKEAIREEYGLDGSPFTRYGLYVWSLLQGDFGSSISNGAPVADTLVDRLPATVELALAGVLLQVLIGLPLGLLSAMTRRPSIDRGVLLVSLLGALAPIFVVGFLLLYLIAYRWGVLPIGGYGNFDNLILPALTIGLAGAPWFARMMRTTVLELRTADHIRFAQAQGYAPRRVLLRHILPNAINPIVTMIGLEAGALIAGVLVIEKVFSWPGIGQQAWLAVSQNDLPMITGVVVIAATAVIVFSLIADVTNMFLDPRIRRA